MKSSEYWKKRFEEMENASNSYGIATYKKIEPAFEQAQREIQKEIEAWYGRLAKNNSVSMQEARKLLSANELKEFHWDVHEYIKYGKENAINQQWMKKLENASAKFHISRLEALKIRTQQAAEKAFGNELDYIDKMARKIYSDTYYHSIFEMQKGFNIGFEIGQIDERKLNKIIVKPWAADGRNFSDRIWQQKAQLVDELHTQLTRNCLLDKAPDDAVKAISKKIGVSKTQAGRLVMTEEAYFHSEAQRDAFKELDVEQFEIVATLDSKTSDICREMDGKHFPMSEYEPGRTAPPFHCWCRSVTVPYFEDDFGEIGERAARNADGKTYYVPADMKYKDWEKKYIKQEHNTKTMSESELQEHIKSLNNQKKQYLIDNSFDIYGDTVEEMENGLFDELKTDDSLISEGEYVNSINAKLDEAYTQLNAISANNSSNNDKVMVDGVSCVKTTRKHGFSDGTSGGVKKTVEAEVYTTPDGMEFIFPKKINISHQTMTPELAISTWNKVPIEIRKKSQKIIEFVDYYNPRDSYWKKQYRNFTHSYAVGGDKITFFRCDYPHDQNYLLKTYSHEVAHFVDKNAATAMSKFSLETEWTNAMKDDKIISNKKSCTSYGENSNVEDFAESVSCFVDDRNAFKKDFPNRAKIIEKLFGF